MICEAASRRTQPEGDVVQVGRRIVTLHDTRIGWVRAVLRAGYAARARPASCSRHRPRHFQLDIARGGRPLRLARSLARFIAPLAEPQSLIRRS